MIFLKKHATLIVLVSLIVSINAQAQDPNFSMYHYTPFFTNPGQIGSVENIRLMLNYRNQAIEAGENFRSSALSGFYPIDLGNHRLVIAGNFLNDQVSDFVSTNGGMLGVGYCIKTSSNSALSLGLQGGYFQRKTDSDFTTDDQFVDGVFDPNIVSGDPVLNQTKSYPTLSGGVYYHISDELQRDKAFVGAAVFNATEPNVSFSDAEDGNLPLSLKATAGYRVYQGLKFSIMPTLRWVNQADNNFFNLGSRFGYELKSDDDGPRSIDLGLWYNTNDLGVFSIAYEQPLFTVGVSYDLPVSNNLSTGQNGIFELAVSFRLKRKSRARVRQHISPPSASAIPTEAEEVKEDEQEPEVVEEEAPAEEIDEPAEELEPAEPVDERREEVVPESETTVEEEVTETATTRELAPEEKKVLAETVTFELNSVELTPDSKAFLDEVVVILKNKDQLKVELTGYTCDLGSEKTNEELSKSRADIVGQYLVKNGIAADRLIVKAGGEDNPVADNDTEESRSRNRRVEFRVVY